jgi:hypothetical protein
MKSAPKCESLETVVNELVATTKASTEQYFDRLTELAALLNKIHHPLTQNPQQVVWIQHVSYNFDDLLILMFEFVQLAKAFQQFAFAEPTLSDFLGFHALRLSQLLRDGKLAHLSQTIEFKNLHAQ